MQKSIHSRDYAVLLRELKAARQRARLTQSELAERIGRTQSFLSKCERGERRVDVLELRTFCGGMGISLATFIKRLEKSLR